MIQILKACVRWSRCGCGCCGGSKAVGGQGIGGRISDPTCVVQKVDGRVIHFVIDANQHITSIAHDNDTSRHSSHTQERPFDTSTKPLCQQAHPPPTMSLTNCRFYEEKYPEIESFVMVNVKQIAEMGAYVKLLEYDNIDGMILLSELSRRRIRSIQKLIRVGRNEVVVVLRVDKEKGYIDLSKRRVSPEDIIKCEERYNKSKMVHSIMRHVAEKTNVPLEELYADIGWPLNKKYGHAVDAFKLSITNPAVWDEVTFKSQVIKDELQSYISKRLTPQVQSNLMKT